MIKVGIIGAGRIGRVHSESISKYVKGAEIKAISDIKITDELQQWAKSMGIPNVYDDYQQILQDPEIDAVLVCSSTNTHAPISRCINALVNATLRNCSGATKISPKSPKRSLSSIIRRSSGVSRLLRKPAQVIPRASRLST